MTNTCHRTVDRLLYVCMNEWIREQGGHWRENVAAAATFAVVWHHTHHTATGLCYTLYGTDDDDHYYYHCFVTILHTCSICIYIYIYRCVSACLCLAWSELSLLYICIHAHILHICLHRRFHALHWLYFLCITTNTTNDNNTRCNMIIISYIYT